MERNFKNHIKWQSIENPIDLKTIKDDVFNIDQIESIFSVGITDNLLEGEETLLENFIQTSSSISVSGADDVSAEVELNIDFGRSSSYEIKRNGETVEPNASFPFTDSLTTETVGEVTYKTQNEAGNTDTSTVVHSPVEISCFVSGPNVTIELDIDRGGPYDVIRNGNTIEENLSGFPFREKVPNSVSGETIYEIINDEGYVDTCKTYPVSISTSYDQSTSTATISLDVNSAGPYVLNREGTEIATGLEAGPDFPYEDNLEDEGGIVEYSIENTEGNVDRSSIAIETIDSS